MSTEVPVSVSTKSLPKLRDDGHNWVIYKGRVYGYLVGQGYRRHLTGREKPPVKPVISPEVKEEQREKLLNDYEDLVEKFEEKEEALRAIVLGTLPEKIQQRIIPIKPVSAFWAKLCSFYEEQSVIIRSDILGQLFDTKCAEGDDPLAVLDKIVALSNDYAAAGGILEDAMVASILIRAVPKEYHSVIHTVTTAAAEAGREISFDAVATRLTEAMKLDNNKEKREKEEAAAMSARLKHWKSKGNMKGGDGGGSKGDKSKITCYNCEKVGHMARDCRAEGGGAHKKGGRSRGRGKKAKGKEDDTEEFAYSVVAAQPAFKASEGKQVRFLDSGASRHFEPDRSNFTSIRPCNPFKIEIADGRYAEATEIGDIRFKCLNKGEPRILKPTQKRWSVFLQ